MNRLDLSEIEAHAGDKVVDTYTLSPECYVLLLHLVTLLSDNQWLFVDAGQDERDLTDATLDELLP